MTKPFSMRELIAQVVPCCGESVSWPPDGILGAATWDHAAHLVTGVANPPVGLKEFEVLRILVARRGEVVSRKTLLEEVWGGVRYRDPRTVDVHIRWLREKIEENPSRPRRILTVHGIGYRLVE